LIPKAGACIAGALVSYTGLLLAGCHPALEPAADAVVTVELDPAPPRVGPASLVVVLSDPGGRPLEGGALVVEANMSHPGMRPLFADLQEVGAGRYAGTLELTMAGDWSLAVTGELPDGRRVDERVDVPVEQGR